MFSGNEGDAVLGFALGIFLTIVGTILVLTMVLANNWGWVLDNWFYFMLVAFVVLVAWEGRS